MMRMAFTWRPYLGESLLFKELKLDSLTGFCVACGIFVVLGLTLETLQCFRIILAENHMSSGKRPTLCSLYHVIQTSLFLVDLILAYFLMLAVMTYNVWFLVAVATGAGIGFILCGTVTRRLLLKHTNHNFNNSVPKQQRGGYVKVERVTSF